MVCHYQQITVSPIIGTIPFHTFPMPISRMAGHTGVAYIKWTETVERLRVLCVGTLKEIFSILELVGHTGILDSRGGVFVSRSRTVEGSTQQSSGIPFLIRNRFYRRINLPRSIFIAASGEREYRQSHQEIF